MVNQLLDLQALTMQSMFSDCPIADNIMIDGHIMSVVAINQWILPRDCFIMLWMWYMVEGRAYNKLYNHAAWDPIIAALNPDQVALAGLQGRTDQYLALIFEKMYSEYTGLSFTPAQKRDMFSQVLMSWSLPPQRMVA